MTDKKVNKINDKKSLSNLKRIYGFVKKYNLLFIMGILGNVAYSALDAGFTAMIKPLLDQGFIAHDPDFIRMVPIVALIAISFRGVTNFIGTYCMSYVARAVVMDFRQKLFAQYMRMPASYFDNNSSGKILSRLLYDVEQVALVSADALVDFLQSACMVLGCFTVMFYESWRLTLIYFVTVPVIAVIVRKMSQRTRKISQTLQQNMGRVTETAEESIEGYRVVRVYGGESYEMQKFNEATNRVRGHDMKLITTKAASTAGVLLLAGCGTSMIFYQAMTPGAPLNLTAGAFASFMGAMLLVLKPLKTLTSVSSTIQRGLTGAESVFEILDMTPETDSGTQSLPTNVDAVIEYNNISFKYETSEDLILNDVSFRVEAGKSVALVGRSGSGKTTIASLLPRFYELSQGSITIAGIDIRKLSLAELRKNIAIVSQDVVLFNDTIANNIAYGCEVKDQRRIREAAIAAHADLFIDEMPDGFETWIGENGVLLSGGQRQRLAIARAIYKNAPILILDEATSALDTQAERIIQAALQSVMKNRTTIVIAHRLSTIESVDTIIVLDKGCILESGSHQALLKARGHYAKLHSMQFAAQELTPEMDCS